RRDRESTPVPEVEEVEDKTSDKISNAQSYIQRLGRAATFDSAGARSSPPSAPTPPPLRETPYAPPPHSRPHIHHALVVDDDDEDEYVPRSRAQPSRRNSHDPPRSKDRFVLLDLGGGNVAPVLVTPLGSLPEMAAEAAAPPRM